MRVLTPSIAALGLLILTSSLLLISRNWRWTIASLSAQYVGVFILVSISWSIELAVVKLVAGWMAAAILGATQVGTPLEDFSEQARPTGSIFRLMAGGLVMLFVISLAPEIVSRVPVIRLDQVIGGLILIGMGLLILGLTSQPSRIALSLLIVVSGFEILYAAVESSVLVAGLLTLINLGLATVGMYLHLAPSLGFGDRA